MRIELNTNLLPVISVGMYESSLSIDVMFDDDFHRLSSSKTLTEGEKNRFYVLLSNDAYEIVVEKYATEALKCFFEDMREQEGLDIQLLDGAKIYNPKEYNFRTDELDFAIEMDDVVFEEIVNRALGNDEFWKWAKKRYRSYDGFICFMPDSKDEFLWYLERGQYDKIVASYLTFVGETVYNCKGEFGYTYLIYENLKNHGLIEFIDEEARGILQRA